MNQIRHFLRQEFDDAHLVKLLDAAKKNQIEFASPRFCLLGRSNQGYEFHRMGLNGQLVEALFHDIGEDNGEIGDRQRCKWLIPVIEREMKYRANKTLKQVKRERIAA